MADEALRLQVAGAIEHHRAGRLAEAESLYRACLSTDADCIDALHLLGVTLRQRGQAAEAEPLLRRAIALNDSVAQFHNNLGNVLRDLGRPEEAAAAYRRALDLEPQNPVLSKNLGECRLSQGRVDEAIAHLADALKLGLQDAAASQNLGLLLQSRGRLSEAEFALRKAIEFAPAWPAPYNNLGNLLHNQGRHAEAVAAFERALALDPNFYEAHVNLANVYVAAGELASAARLLERAISLQPAAPAAHANLAGLLRLSGRSADALTHYRTALSLAPDDASLHSSLLQTMHFVAGETPEAIAEEHRRWADRHAAHFYPRERLPITHRNPSRPLRIGYVSGDFTEHSVMRCVEGLLRHHDPRRCAVTCYSNSTASDAATARLQPLALQWRNIALLSDDEAADLVRRDEIDILVDLNGHTARHRLLVFARRPAPIQVAYFGYQDTTGLATMDWRITDAIADPEDAPKTWRSEHLWRLPRISWCYLPQEVALSPLPAQQRGAVTFGCLNDLNKLTPEIVRVWSRILAAVPDSRLLLLASAAGEGGETLMAEFSKAGINPARIERLRRTNLLTYLGYYRHIDIALDTFPYTGCTTTADALWMGVPVITMAGSCYVRRQGLNLLHSVGLSHLIASDQANGESAEDRAVAIAYTFSRDLPALAALRSTLRERLRAAPLCDAAGLARAMEDAYAQMAERGAKA